MQNLSHARICVENDVSKPFLPSIWTGETKEEGFSQRIDFEGNNAFCTKCGLLDHVAGVCRKGQRKPATKENKEENLKQKQGTSGPQYRVLKRDPSKPAGDEPRKTALVIVHDSPKGLPSNSRKRSGDDDSSHHQQLNNLEEVPQDENGAADQLGANSKKSSDELTDSVPNTEELPSMSPKGTRQAMMELEEKKNVSSQNRFLILDMEPPENSQLENSLDPSSTDTLLKDHDQ